MIIVMTEDGRVRPLQPSDFKEVAERDRRIEALERQCATLAAQVDRDRLVIKMAELWRDNEKGFTRIGLREAVDTYRHTMAQLAKEKHDGTA
jgi:hypothetical protein